MPDDESRWGARLIELATQYGRYGYRRITALLRGEGWRVQHTRVERLDREIFYALTEATILIERWRRQYNSVRPHSALGYRPPAPEAVTPAIVDGLHMSFALS